MINDMKKIYSKLIAVLAMVATTGVFSSCDTLAYMDNGTFLFDMVISGPGVVNHEATLEMESTLQLSCAEKFSGMNEVVWTSLDESVAKVDARSGLVTPVAPGRVKITAYTDTEPVRNGDYIYVTVVGKSISIVNDALNQSLAD